jgi:hypothetical protein
LRYMVSGFILALALYLPPECRSSRHLADKG